MILIGDKRQFKANLHSHSNLSDGTFSPEELKRIYKEKGYSVLAITDHDYPCDHSELNDDDFLMLTGYEATIRVTPDNKYDIYAPEIHINLFAREPGNVTLIDYAPNHCKYLLKNPEHFKSIPKVDTGKIRIYDTDYVNEFLKTATGIGYICSHNHPTWSLEEDETVYKYRGFFSMEMANYISREYNAALYEKLLKKGTRIFCHGGDDNHNREPLNSRYSDSFGAFTVIEAESLDYKSVFSALENGNFYASRGPMIHELRVEGKRAYIKTSPCDSIWMYYGAKHKGLVYDESGDGITEAVFEIPEDAAFVRFSVFDKFEKSADTRGFFRDELGI